MSKNKIDRGIVGLIKGNEKKQSVQESNWFRGRHRMVMLDSAIQVLSLASQSSTSWVDIDLSGYTSTGTSDISDDTFCAILYIALADSSGASATPAAFFRKNGTSDAIGQLGTSCDHGHSHYMYSQGQVGLDSNYIFEYKLQAGGANTMSIQVYLVGYIEQIS